MSPSNSKAGPREGRREGLNVRSGARQLSRTDDATLTLFSFGYWGAGSATRALVDGVNEAEALRGFDPALWVDVRLSRAVRAAGFRDRAFEQLLGSNYMWMRDLGNACIGQGRRGEIEIAKPAAAEQLLDHALRTAKRRVVFFCACKYPAVCHRYEVGKLVKAAARKRGIEVNVVEWPGGTPETITIEVSAAVLRVAARNGRATLDVPSTMSVGSAASVPWGSIGALRAGKESINVVLGPAQFTERGVHLRMLGVEPEPGPEDVCAFRRECGFDPLQ